MLYNGGGGGGGYAAAGSTSQTSIVKLKLKSFLSAIEENCKYKFSFKNIKTAMGKMGKEN